MVVFVLRKKVGDIGQFLLVVNNHIVKSEAEGGGEGGNRKKDRIHLHANVESSNRIKSRGNQT